MLLFREGCFLRNRSFNLSDLCPLFLSGFFLRHDNSYLVFLFSLLFHIYGDYRRGRENLVAVGNNVRLLRQRGGRLDRRGRSECLLTPAG